MPQVELTSQLAQLAECPAIQQVDGRTLGDVLDHLFDNNEQMRQHILDDNGAIHSHLALFVDGQMVDRDQLKGELESDSEIFLMQALSGG